MLRTMVIVSINSRKKNNKNKWEIFKLCVTHIQTIHKRELKNEHEKPFIHITNWLIQWLQEQEPKKKIN